MSASKAGFRSERSLRCPWEVRAFTLVMVVLMIRAVS